MSTAGISQEEEKDEDDKEFEEEEEEKEQDKQAKKKQDNTKREVHKKKISNSIPLSLSKTRIFTWITEYTKLFIFLLFSAFISPGGVIVVKLNSILYLSQPPDI